MEIATCVNMVKYLSWETDVFVVLQKSVKPLGLFTPLGQIFSLPMQPSAALKIKDALAPQNYTSYAGHTLICFTNELLF